MASLSHSRGSDKSRADVGNEAGIPIGHVYLDVRRRLLYCLDDTARRFQGEGIPFTDVEPSRQALTTLAGKAVAAADLPLILAWREGRPAEAVFVLARKGAAVQHVQWTAAPLCDGNGEVVAIVGTILLRAPEPDWQLLAGLAHDLRNPLQALRLSVDELSPSDLPADLREAVARIRGAAERALSVGKDILEWVRGPAQGGRRVEPGWFALEPFLTALVAEQGAAVRQKGLVLAQDLRAARGWEIQSDGVRLSRLLANLLANAVRYTATGRVEFAASWRQDAGGGRHLCLGVHDTGAGITPEEQESIFQPFERGTAAKGDSSGGSGLGLSVVDRLVAELGLTLEVSSDVGRGSSFQLLFPATMLRQAPV